MPQTPYHNRVPVRISPTPQRPSQDMVTVKKQAGQFPGIGMTLRNYQYDPRDRHKRGGPTVVRKAHWWEWFYKDMSRKKVAKMLAGLVALVILLVGGNFLWNLHKLFGNPFGFLSTTRLRGEDTGHVNILLAGNSADDPGHGGANLTDSIMLISLNIRKHTVFMLSLPRDLWVPVGDYGYEKINAAYVTGEDNGFNEKGYPKGGMGQLEKVVSDKLGIPIHYYALIDYKALKQAVDAVGGVDITIKSNDPRGIFDPDTDWVTGGYLVPPTSNGRHHFNGEQALDLARARGDAYGSYGFDASDFDRTMHQRQLLAALKSKVVSAGTFANPAKVTKLSDALGNNVKTDFKLSEVHRLYDLTKGIKGNDLQSLSLNDAGGQDLLASYSAPGGQSALIPAAGVDNYYDIQSFISRQMSSDRVVREGANVVVLNGTNTDNLAGKAKKKLTGKKVIVSRIGDAAGPHKVTSIIDISDSKKPATKKVLKKMFGSHFTKNNPYAGIYDADFIVVLGNDQIKPLTTSGSGH